MDRGKAIKVLETIILDMENDARSLDSLPFTGLTVGKQLGQLYAAIQAIAHVLQGHLSKAND